MKESSYSEFLKKYRDEAMANKSLSDDEMANAKGGVGGANEATCPKCGRPMSRPTDPNGPQSDVWTCDACGTYQLFSDADTIEIIRYMEANGIGGIEYPIWWNQINH